MRSTNFRRALGTCLFSISTAAFSATGCQKPDASFDSFLKKFIEDFAFRLERTTQPLAFQGSTPDGRRPKELTVLDLKSASISKLLLPMSNRQLEMEDAKNDEKWAMGSTVLFAKDSVTVIQGSHDADVWSRTYRFQRIGGCWLLIGLQVGGQ